jgi:hypothetical protein
MWLPLRGGGPVIRSAASRLVSAAGSRLYSIGVYAGPSPAALAPVPGVNPVVAGADVTDALVTTVADPFMIRVDGLWHMFFEALVWSARGRKGEIAHATSADGRRWDYDRIVLEEPFHLSYPYVFEWRSEHYMIPESARASEVRLYRAAPFPHRWVHVKTLLSGAGLMDSSVFHRDGRWWMLTDGSPSHGHDTLRLFHAAELTGPWLEHPQSPVVRDDPRRARPGGRVVQAGDALLRFAQVCEPTYGSSVRTFEIVALTQRDYEEVEIAGPALGESGRGWNRSGMHHVDLHPLDDGTFLACVDGWAASSGPVRRLATAARTGWTYVRDLRAARGS